VWKCFFFVCCAHSCQALPLWSELNKTLQNKDGVHFFTLEFEWHNRYNKLLLCNSENNDIAWCNQKTIKNKVFPFSLKKEQNLVSFQITQKKRFFFWKTGGCFFLNPGFSQPWTQPTVKWRLIWFHRFIVSYDSANKHKQCKKTSCKEAPIVSGS